MYNVHACCDTKGQKLNDFFSYVFSPIIKSFLDFVVVAFYHVTFEVIGHGLLKNFWPMLIGCLLHTAGCSKDYLSA